MTFDSVSASLGFDVVSGNVSRMEIQGVGTLPPLEVLFGEANLGPPNVDEIMYEQATKLKAKKGFRPKDFVDASVTLLSGSISAKGVSHSSRSTSVGNGSMNRTWGSNSAPLTFTSVSTRTA